MTYDEAREVLRLSMLGQWPPDVPFGEWVERVLEASEIVRLPGLRDELRALEGEIRSLLVRRREKRAEIRRLSGPLRARRASSTRDE